jgi:acetyl-CoA/propionyl-CoA carboxylase biotin carboxyl carrier protein
MFDSLAAKLIVWGPTRAAALARSRRALSEFEIDGVPSVLPFHRAVVDHPDFAGGHFRVHTRWIENDFAADLVAAARPAQPAAQSLLRGTVEIDGKKVSIGLPATFLALLGQVPSSPTPVGPADERQADENAVCAPVPGTLVQWNVANGDEVREGEIVAMMDAMKMETSVAAPATGIISILAEAGSFQKAGAVIARLAPAGKAEAAREEHKSGRS